ncbi:MAG TPA: hypothetical protein VHG35_04470 [Gemmatimonadales bacterium]|nr:hypothetical protein [Gemmatimonadales bacterium]
MDSAAELRGEHDVTDVPSIVRGAVLLGLFESVVVLLFSLASRYLAGPLETVVLALLLLLGLAPVTLLPGIWTRARTIEGIAGAAGIGLGATFVFLLIDVVLLQHIGTYTNRWWQIGGSNWWYHPVWWMVGTFLPWLGAWILANQAERNGRISAPAAFGTAVGFALLAGVVAILIGFPGADWNLPTFGVAFLPGLALATALSALGGRRA